MAKNYLPYPVQRQLEVIIQNHLGAFEQNEDGTPSGTGCVYGNGILTDGDLARIATQHLGRTVTWSNVRSLREAVFGPARRGVPVAELDLIERVAALEARVAELEARDAPADAA